MDRAENIKLELTAYGKKLAEKGLVVGPGGNISAKSGSKVYLKASGAVFEDAKESDYIEVELLTGKQISGALHPSCELWMHLYCYEARKDIKAIVHSHPLMATMVATTARSLKPLTCEFVAIMGSDVPLIGYYPPGSKALAAAVSKAIKHHNGVLMANHGTLTVGATIKEAYYRTLSIEAESHRHIIANGLGKAAFLTKRQVEAIKKSEATLL